MAFLEERPTMLPTSQIKRSNYDKFIREIQVLVRKKTHSRIIKQFQCIKG